MDLSDADEKLKEVVEVRGYVGGRESGGTWVRRGRREWRYVPQGTEREERMEVRATGYVEGRENGGTCHKVRRGRRE